MPSAWPRVWVGAFPLVRFGSVPPVPSYSSQACTARPSVEPPLACAAALAVLDVIESERLLEKVAFHSVPWISVLSQLARDFPQRISGVRGHGYMIGLQFTGDPSPYVAGFREAGLLAPMAGGNVVRLLPPLTASPEELAQSVEIVRSVLKRASV